MYYYLVGLALLGSCLADGGPQDSFQSRSAEYAPVKYGGPIVYSGENHPLFTSLHHQETLNHMAVAEKVAADLPQPSNMYLYLIMTCPY